MIPILYESTETAFTSNGLGRLHDTISAVVVEERNSIYECDFQYPVTGDKYELIKCGRIIGVRHDDSQDIQPFDIVSVSRPINGVVTFHCTHISYRQSGYAVYGTNINSLSDAFDLLKNNAKPSNPFTYWSDFSSSAYMSAADGTPRTVRQMLGGVEGSILDAYRGEYEWDKFQVKLYKQRGTQRDFKIRYGVNLLDYTDDTDYQGTYTSCIPYWSGSDGVGGNTLVVGNKTNSDLPSVSGRDVCIALDLTEKFETKPTKTQLQNLAKSMMQSGQVNLPKQTITVDFVRLQDLGEFEGFDNLLQCKLCDSIKVEFPKYGMSGWFKIVKTTFDVLRGKYTKLELGDLSTTLAEALGITGNKTGAGVGLITVDNNNDVNIASNVIVSGGITVQNHAQRIGYVPSQITETTSAITSSTTYSNTGKGFTLDPGTWMLVGSVRFQAINATGIRAAAWGASSVLESSRVRTKPAGSGYVDDLQTVAIVQPSSTTAFNIWVAQNSGDNTMTATINARAVRIE